MASNKYISLSISGRPEKNWTPIVLFNNPQYEIEDKVPGGFKENTYFFIVRTRASYVVYELIRNNVKAGNDDRISETHIAIEIPKGFKLENGVSPLDVLIDIMDKLLSRCMTCKDSSSELYAFNGGLPDPNIVNDVAVKYTLCPCKGRYIPMQGPNVGYVIVNEEKIRELFNDIHYSEFAEYGEIIVAENMNSSSYAPLNIQIPRVHSYQIVVDGRPAGEETDKTKRLTFFGNRDPKYYEKDEISFTIQQLLDGDIIPNVSLDVEKEIISVNTAFLDKPKVKNVKLALRSSKVQSYFDKNPGNLELRYGGINGENIPVTRNLTIALKGEKLQYLENPSGFVVHLYRSASGNYKMTGAVTYRDDALILPIEPVGQQPQIVTPIGGGCIGKNTKSLRLVFSSDEIADYFRSNPKEIDLRYDGKLIEVSRNLTVTLNENQVNYLNDLDGFAVRLYEKAKKKFQVNQQSSVEYNGRDKLYLPITKAGNKVLTIAMYIGIGVLVAAILAAGGYFGYKHFLAKEYPCEKAGWCDSIFSSEEKLADHIQRIHEKTEDYKCKQCQESFDSDSLLTEHMKMHAEDMSQLKCAQCGEKCSTAEELSRHTVEKHPIAPKVPCDQCTEKFDTQAELNAHKASVHPATSEKKFPCDKCSQKFETQAKLNSHKASAHPATSEKKFPCDKCSQKFETQAKLNAHKTSAHPVAPKVTCDKCGKPFDTAAKLESHKKSTHGYICEKCHKKYATNAEMQSCFASHER